MDIDNDLNTSRPTAVYTPTPPRLHTVSLALPTSLLTNSKRKLDLRTHLAGSISRALSVFSVDEIVLFDDGDSDDSPNNPNNPHNNHSQTPHPTKLTAFSHPAHFLRYILTYQETPPFMRNRLFPMHENLSQAGLLPSLDIPSHLKAMEYCEYREGITVRSVSDGTYVDCGLPAHRLVKGVQVPPKTRVTLRIDGDQNSVSNGSVPTAEIVSPATPREQGGYYWGYTIRTTPTLSAVFTECPFDGGYDLSIGTSERGQPINPLIDQLLDQEQTQTTSTPWNHLILVFGGVKGLEEAAANDAELRDMGIGRGNVDELFDYWVNLVPGQGSRTIRTEEAVWIGLMGVRRIVEGREGV